MIKQLIGNIRGEPLPWCSGYIKDASLGKDVWTTMTPIYEQGESSMINGNLFVPITDGLYVLSVGGGFYGAMYSGNSRITLTATAGYSHYTNYAYLSFFPASVSRTERLKIGDSFRFILQGSTTIPSFSTNNERIRFTFAQLR